MNKIINLNGDATLPYDSNADYTKFAPTLIVHVCNDKGLWNAGFAKSLAVRWPSSRAAYIGWSRWQHGQAIDAGAVNQANLCPQPKVGVTQFVEIQKGLLPGNTSFSLIPKGRLYVANMVAQNGIRSANNPKPINYEALEICLGQVAGFAQAMRIPNIQMPKIGCGLAGGDWNIIQPLLEKELVFKPYPALGLNIYIYDYDKPPEAKS
jgi:O-acetyl-ADP-ribose deacetylase (regulator of RNase III)